MKNSFPKRIKRHSKKCDSNVNLKFVECVLEKSSSYMLAYIHTYLQIYEELFPKSQSMNLALTLETYFLESRLTRFGSEFFIYIYIYIYIYKQ